MERLREASQYAALGCRRCAALLVTVIKDGKQIEEWRIYSDPTIGELQSLRRKGAIVMRRVVQRFGNQIDRTWITDSGREVVVSTEFLQTEKAK